MLMRALARMLAVVSVLPSADAQLGETLAPRLSSRQSCVVDLYDMWDACSPLVVAGMDALEANAGCPSAESPAPLLDDGVAMDAADTGKACCAVFERLDKSDCLCTPDVVSLLPSLPTSAANGGLLILRSLVLQERDACMMHACMMHDSRAAPPTPTAAWVE
jgi:hypothetical protein